VASDRERFLAALYTAPILPADAIVVLCGEDAEERGHAAVELLRQGAAPTVVCSGRIDTPPRRVSGAAVSTALMTRGLAPDRILVESGSQNTHEQAVNVLDLADANGWTRLILVASNYHLPRAFLTFVKALGDRRIRLIPYATSHLSWWDSPPGMTETRVTLFDRELAKIDEYADHVATCAEGLAYLQLTDRV
jgi:uncharacterized SAM-binding protein YcdF (DUF218 family)